MNEQATRGGTSETSPVHSDGWPGTSLPPTFKGFQKAADGDHDDHDEIFNGGVLPKTYQCKGLMMMVMI